jgi:hypothetical protein
MPSNLFRWNYGLRYCCSVLIMYLGLPSLALRQSNTAFAVSQLFSQGEPGFHAETYNPDSLLQRRNRFNYSSQFSNSYWAKGNILSVTDDADGVGDLVVPNTTLGAHTITNASAASAGASCALTVRAKAGGYDYILLQVGNGGVYFDVANGAIGTNIPSTSSAYTPTIAAAADAPGYYDCVVTLTSALSAAISIQVAEGNGNNSYAGNGVSGVYLARAQIEWNTTTPTTYQAVTDWYTEYLAARYRRLQLRGAGLHLWLVSRRRRLRHHSQVLHHRRHFR